MEINNRTSVKRLTEIKDTCKQEQIPDIIKKMVSYKMVNTHSKMLILMQLILKYYTDKLFITDEDLKKLNLGKSEIDILDDRKEFSKKYVNLNVLNFGMLPTNILKEILPRYDDNIFKEKINLNGLIKTEYRYEGNKYILDPDKLELCKMVSDRLNKIYSSDTDVNTNFIDCMATLNAMLGRNNLNKGLDNKISEYYKRRYAEYLKLPISFNNLYLGDINLNEVQYITKGQPNNTIYLSHDNFIVAAELAEHLKDFKIVFRISKRSLDQILIRSYGKPQQKKLLNILNKFPLKPRVGKSIEEGNIKIIIE